MQLALQRGDITTQDMIADRLSRSTQTHSRLNAFIEVLAEDALTQAKASDCRRRAGQRLSALEGIPIGLKDMFSTSGRQCSFGAPRGAIKGSETAATVAVRLRAAGAINLGFLNMAPFALGPTGHNPTYGDCRNPWSPDRIAGGSSSGAGAAVSAGILAGSIGSDTGGSIRIPAACCGVVGLRPTSGRVSRYGAMPLAHSLDVIGPIAKSAEDVGLLFSVICGPDPHDPATRLPNDWQRPVTTLGTRIFYPKASIAAGASEEVARAVDQAVEVLRACGQNIQECVLPDIGELHRLGDVIQATEAAAVHASRIISDPSAYAPHILRRIKRGFGIPAPAYVDALNQRYVRRKDFVRQILRGAGVLITPTLAQGTPTLADTDPETHSSPAGMVAGLTQWTRWVSYLDLPAISLPGGFDGNGMPIGLQLIGAPFREHQLLDLACLYERAARWHTDPGLS